MTVRSSKSDNFYFFIYCHIWVKMVQYFHKFIKIIPQILKLLGIKTTKGRKLIGLSMELLWRLGYHYEAFNTQSRKKGSSLRSSPEGLRASPQQKSGPPPFWAFGPNEFKRQIQAILTFQAPVSKATQKKEESVMMLTQNVSILYSIQARHSTAQFRGGSRVSCVLDKIFRILIHFII